MNKKALIGGAICGLVCALCVFAYTYLVYQDADNARAEAMERYGGEQVEVLVATRDLYPGETLDSSNTETKLWVSDLLPEGCITKAEDGWGKQLTSFVIKGEAISTRRFESETSDIDIPAGKVAITVPAEDVQAVGGALSAGNMVDVYATGVDTTCLGEDILVLATNASSSEGSSTKSSISWVTIAVDPDKVQEYVAASQELQIYFVLPSGVDDQTNPSSQEQTDAAGSARSDESDAPAREESESA